MIPDQWLSKILNRPVYRLEVDRSFSERFEEIKREEESVFCSKPVFIHAKVPTEQLLNIQTLEDLGFHLVDTNIVFNKPLSENFNLLGNCEVRFAMPEDETQTVDLAGKSIVYSRFHQDNNFSIETANKLKAEWVRNYFSGKRGQAMVIALAEGAIVGFLQLLISKDGIMRIDLMAVDAGQQRKGIGKDMIAFAEMNSCGIKQVCVGTQIVNIPSIRFYQNLGFNMAEAHYVFHYHNL
jgi:ribosomal protein S18 acetylase RimI-like enzyme